jgi:hypothetical protein
MKRPGKLSLKIMGGPGEPEGDRPLLSMGDNLSVVCGTTVERKPTIAVFR